MRHVIFDIEATGLHRENDRICSIALIDDETGHEFYAEFNPRKNISKGALEAHGLTPQRLRSKPLWTTLGPAVWRWLMARQRPGEPIVLVGHNAHSYDIRMLGYELGRLQGLNPPKGPILVADTLKMCRDAFPKTVLASKRQAAVYEHLFGEQPGAQHNALGDTRALRRVFASDAIRRRAEMFTEPVAGSSWWPNHLTWKKT